jgi:hypothetical protein
MPKRKRISVFLDAEHLAGLKGLKKRDGITEAEAIRRAVGEFLKRKGIKAGRKRS